MEAFLHTTFIPSCADIEQYAPEETTETGMYKAFPQLQEPEDRVTQEQLDRFNAKVREICEGKTMEKKHPEREELQEIQSKGMKAKVVDGKAAGANDK